MEFGERPMRQDWAQLMQDHISMWRESAAASADIAHSKRTVFNAYVSEGFTEAQALELIKSL